MQQLVSLLTSRGVVVSPSVRRALLTTDRGDFTHESFKKHAYEDRPLPIDYEVTISAPHMHAYALEFLRPALKRGGKVLDIGSGSGYLCVAFMEMMEGDGHVIGVEHVPQLAQKSIENISKSHKHLLDSKKIRIIEGDGREALANEAPFDVIHVGAAMKSLPKSFYDQLKENGMIMAPVGPKGGQKIILVTNLGHGNFSTEEVLDVNYVPLTSKEEQCPSLFKK